MRVEENPTTKVVKTPCNEGSTRQIQNKKTNYNKETNRKINTTEQIQHTYKH